MYTDDDLILETDSNADEELKENPNQPTLDSTPETVAEMVFREFQAIYQTVQQQSDDTYEYMQTLQAEVLAQATLITQLHKQLQEHQDNVKRLVQQTKDVPDQLQALIEPVQKLKNYQDAQALSSRRETRSIPVGPKFSPRVICLLLLGNCALIAIATVLSLRAFPPDASAKTQQQFLAMFQRIDRLYKDKFGNSSTK